MRAKSQHEIAELSDNILYQIIYKDAGTVADLRNIDGYQQGVRGDRLSIGHGRSLRNGA